METVVRHEKVVKCKFKTILRHDNPNLDLDLETAVENAVQIVSVMSHKASLLLNDVLLDYMSAGRELPLENEKKLFFTTDSFIKTILNAGLVNMRPVKSDIRMDVKSHLAHIWNERWEPYMRPVINALPDTPSLSQAMSYAAKTYATAFKNSLTGSAFESRQKRWIRFWCISNDIDPKLSAYAIRAWINNWNSRPVGPLDKSITEFVDSQRQLLGMAPTDVLSDKLLASRPHIVLTYYFHCLKFLEGFQDARLFTLAPLCSINRKFVTLDIHQLKRLVKPPRTSGMRPKDAPPEPSIVSMERFFSVEKFQTRTSKFANVIQTDGVAACVHYHDTRTVMDDAPRERQRELEARAKESSVRVIALDPGRANIACTFEVDSHGKQHTHRLTRSHYYHASGIRAHRKKSKEWMDVEAPTHADASTHSPKTSSPDTFNAYIHWMFTSGFYNQMWALKLQRKWSNAKFELYGEKRRVLDAFFSQVTKPVDERKETIIAYGAAKFSATGNGGELTVPTCSAFNACKRQFRSSILLVNEYNTSKICPECNACAFPILREGKSAPIRGLRWCRSTKCRKFMDRDLMAAKNIWRAARSNRPTELTREFKYECTYQLRLRADYQSHRNRSS